MLISSANLLPEDIGAFVRLAVLCAFSGAVAIWVNGWFQALVATALGDPAPRAQGRSLRQSAAAPGYRRDDPGNRFRIRLGTAVAGTTGDGKGDGHRWWCRPPDRWGNVTVAFLLASPVKAGLLGWTYPSPDSLNLVMTGGLRSGISDVVGLLIIYNLMQAAFQVLPLAPLAGYRALGRPDARINGGNSPAVPAVRAAVAGGISGVGFRAATGDTVVHAAPGSQLAGGIGHRLLSSHVYPVLVIARSAATG